MPSKAAFILFIATGGGLGRLPKAPGTFGTLLGVPLAVVINRLDWPGAVAALIALIIFAVVISHFAEGLLGQQDPGSVVIDEVAGMVLTLFGLALNVGTIALGFALFRVLDILKPFPIGWLDRKLSGGAGIVADDVAAGIMANLILQIILFLAGG